MNDTERPTDTWQSKFLGQLGQWFSGGTPSLKNAAYWDGDTPWVSPKDMKRPRLWDSIDHIGSRAIADGARVLPAGTVLIVVRGMILAHSLPVARTERSIAFNQDIKALVPQAGVDSEFVLYWLEANKQSLRALITESTHGTKRLATEALFEQEVQCPPPFEQRAIAAALSDAEALIDSLNALVAKRRDLKLAAMQQLLTGKSRLPGFTEGWECLTVGQIADVKTGPFGSTLHESDYVDDGIPIITVEHLGEFGVTRRSLPMVSAADHDRLRAYRLNRGDIVFSRVGSVDRNCLIREGEEGWLFSGRLLRVRPIPTRVHSPFLSFLFHTEGFRNAVLTVAVGQTMASLNTSILRGLQVLLPPFEEQASISAILSDFDAEIIRLEARRDKVRALKQGMMQELLTGRIRLI